MAKTATAQPKAAASAAPAAGAKRSYFLTYLLPTSYTESELATFNDQIAILVTKHKGKVSNTEAWGKKKMAYQIKHSGKWHTEANYVHLTVELDPAEAQALEKDMYLNPNVIRHLFVLAENNQAE